MELLSPSSKNKKKILSKKRSYIFRKWSFLALILRNFLHFLERKEMEIPKTFLIFQEALPKPQKPKFLKYFSKKKLSTNFSKNTLG